MYPHCQMMIRGSLCLKSAVAEKPLSHDVSQSIAMGDMKRMGVVYLMWLVISEVCPVCVNLKLNFEGIVDNTLISDRFFSYKQSLALVSYFTSRHESIFLLSFKSCKMSL